MDSPQPNPTPTPASAPGDVSPALPGSPETQGVQPTAPAPASVPTDPYAAYANLDYEELLQEFPIEGMDVKELSSVYGPARESMARFGTPGFADALEVSGAGNDAGILRGLAAISQDFQGLLKSAREMNSSYKGLSQQLGQRVQEINPPPLTGEALQRETIKFLEYYFPASSAQAYARSLAQEPAAMQTITRAVQEFHRLERALHQAGSQQQQLEAQRESPSALRTMPDGRRFTVEDLDLESDRLWGLRHAASRAHDLNEVKRLDALITRVGKARFGG
jgi:hypothetical protein